VIFYSLLATTGILVAGSTVPFIGGSLGADVSKAPLIRLGFSGLKTSQGIL